MNQVLTAKQQAMQNSINRACKRQRIVGMLYFFGVLMMTIAAFFPLITGVSFTVSGDLHILNFWGAMAEMAYFKLSVFAIGMNFFVSLLYVFIVTVCLVNLVLAVVFLDGLFTKGSMKIGYNQNALAMERLGKIFSSTYVALLYLIYFTHMFIATKPTALFYMVTVLFLVIHFIGGYADMGTSRFEVDGGVKELPRVKGRILPLVRNAMQVLLVAALMYFMSEANIINNFLFFFNKDSWITMFGDFKANFGTIISRCVNPLLQLSICHFMLVIVVHATNPTEWHKDGGKAKGMLTTRIFAGLIALFALLFNATKLYLNLAHDVSAVSLQMIFVAVIALAFLGMELFLANMPEDKDKKDIVAAEPVDCLSIEDGEEDEDGENAIVGGAENAAQEDGRVFATPIATNALKREAYKALMKKRWMERGEGDYDESLNDGKVYKKPADEDEELILGKDKKVKCPHCGEIVWAKEGALAYVCPECGERFSF